MNEYPASIAFNLPVGELWRTLVLKAADELHLSVTHLSGTHFTVSVTAPGEAFAFGTAAAGAYHRSRQVAASDETLKRAQHVKNLWEELKKP